MKVVALRHALLMNPTYLKAYNLKNGKITLTNDLKEAQEFASEFEALMTWSFQPKVPPNVPLSAFVVEILPLPQKSDLR
jgi:hypothetical protein